MHRRIAAVTLFALAAYVAYYSFLVARVMVDMLFSGGWLGPEPEIGYPVAGFLVATLLAWAGARLWRRRGDRDLKA